MKAFTAISEEERDELLKFPVYITLLAANSDGHLDKAEKKAAEKLEHIKTYSSEPELIPFYKEADKVFKQSMMQINTDLPKDKAERNIIIKAELMKLDKLVLKLDKDYAAAMHRSMETFTKHVSKAHHNVLSDFIFPFPIKGLTY